MALMTCEFTSRDSCCRIARIPKNGDTFGVDLVTGWFATWLLGQLADAGRRRLTTFLLGDEQERALRVAANAAIRMTARDVCPGDGPQADQVTMVIDQVFGELVADAPVARQATLLRALQAGITARLAPLDDADLTGTGTSSAELLGVSTSALAETLTDHLMREIVSRGSHGGPLTSLANQLGHDVTHGKLDQLAHIIGGKPPEDPVRLAEAETLLATLPADRVPRHGRLPVGSLMILKRNPLFIGRTDELRVIAAALKAGNTVGVVAATGMGGLGKTQLAAEFVHRYGRYFAGGVFWLSFADPKQIPSEIAKCAGPGFMGLTADNEKLLDSEKADLVRSAWQSELPRLLVFDNCEEEELLDMRPASGGCRVLVTSRRPRWSPTLGVTTVPLDVLPRDDSMKMLRGYLRESRPDLDADERDLKAIAAELGDLALALHLAGSYMRRHAAEVSPAAYLQELRGQSIMEHASMLGGGLLGEAPHSPTGHVQVMARTFQLSYQRLGDDICGELARELLLRAALLAPGEPIPRHILLATLAGAGDDQLPKFALGRLVDTGLVGPDAQGPYLVHRFVVAFALHAGGEAMSAARTDVESAMLGLLETANENTSWDSVLEIQAHLRHVGGAVLRESHPDERSAELCDRLGHFLRLVGGDLSASRSYLERALQIREQVLEPDHSKIATTLNNLGWLMRGQGDLASARPLLERALGIRERVLRPDDPDIAYSVAGLGRLLIDLGELAAARPLLERALEIRKKVLPADHHDTTTSKAYLAELLHDEGELDAAIALVRQALEDCERIFEPDHFWWATTAAELALWLREQGDVAEAHRLAERAVDICERKLGASHPHTATALESLALAHQAEGNATEAANLQRRALDIRELVLGPNHYLTATSLNNLGRLLQDQGNPAEALPLYERALAIREQTLGPDHPDTARVRTNLSSL